MNPNWSLTAGAVNHTYDVFGEPRSGDPESETFLFTGEQYDARARDVRLIDADPGLYYLRARYYDPEIGRFISQDPLPGGITGMLARSGLKHLARYIPVDVGGCAPQAAAASLVVGTNYSKE